MYRTISERWALLGLWGAVVGLALYLRPLLPIDETRYLTVAWEMWVGGEYLVPQLNGSPYSHKPPLLFWLFHLGWGVFGVNEWWPRLVAPLSALGSAAFTVWLARLLWPQRREVAETVPWVLFGTAIWLMYLTVTLFDLLLTLAVLATLAMWLSAARGGTGRHWLLAGVSLGLGVLAKGPVVLLHTLPLALLAPLWVRRDQWIGARRWYAGVAVSVLVAAALALGWAIPAALSGGEAYAAAILWGQTVDRVAESFAHGRPWWWYLPMLPGLLAPWFFWPSLWRGMLATLRAPHADSGLRFTLVWLLMGITLFSIVSGKQVHYLLPLAPAWALLVARMGTAAVSKRWDLVLPILLVVLGALTLALLPWVRGDEAVLADVVPLDWTLAVPLLLVAVVIWRGQGYGNRGRVIHLTVAMALLFVLVHLLVVRPLAPAHDLRDVAALASEAQQQGRLVGHMGRYAGQYTFLGRLREPVVELRGTAATHWALAHPDGLVISRYPAWRPPVPARRILWRPYRGEELLVWDLGGSPPALE